MADEEEVAWRATPERAPVVDAQGNELGVLEAVLADEGDDIFHGLAVKLRSGGLVEIAAEHVSRITTERIYTSLTSEAASSLPAYDEGKSKRPPWVGLFRQEPGGKG
jgi:hypothetical protein